MFCSFGYNLRWWRKQRGSCFSGAWFLSFDADNILQFCLDLLHTPNYILRFVFSFAFFLSLKCVDWQEVGLKQNILKNDYYVLIGETPESLSYLTKKSVLIPWSENLANQSHGKSLSNCVSRSGYIFKCWSSLFPVRFPNFFYRSRQF